MMRDYKWRSDLEGFGGSHELLRDGKMIAGAYGSGGSWNFRLYDQKGKEVENTHIEFPSANEIEDVEKHIVFRLQHGYWNDGKESPSWRPSVLTEQPYHGSIIAEVMESNGSECF